MPLMQLAATVLDHVSINRGAIEATTLRYAETDTVCYRADEPVELVRRQRAAWDSLLDWLTARYDVTLTVSTGIVPVKQSAEALTGLALAMLAMDDWRLCAFQSAVASSGSYVIALALIEGRISAEQAFHAAEIEASYEIERWGEDAEATRRRRVAAADLAAARHFIDLLAD
jgi:chaperone required for assembly of F1-ATPase